MVTLIFTVAGIGLNVLVLRDMFHTLFSPVGNAALSSGVARIAWRTVRSVSRGEPDRLCLAGPLSILLIILSWTVGLILGWACILWPHLPDRFLLSSGMVAEGNESFLDAVYLSMVTLGTLGYGEITPQATWIRIVIPLEAFIGFALFTASVSWLMSIHPALSRRRFLARDIALLDRTHQRAGISLVNLGSSRLADNLHVLASQVIKIRDDLVQFPVTYYFRTSDPQSSLEAHLPLLLAWGRAAAEHDDDEVQLHATMLIEALGDLASYLAGTWLDSDQDASIEDILDAYARDHLREPT